MRQCEPPIDFIDSIYLRRVALLVLSVFFVSFSAQSTFGQAFLSQSGQWKAMPVLVLQGLDKITARVSEFEIEVGQVGLLGT